MEGGAPRGPSGPGLCASGVGVQGTGRAPDLFPWRPPRGSRRGSGPFMGRWRRVNGPGRT